MCIRDRPAAAFHIIPAENRYKAVRQNTAILDSEIGVFVGCCMPGIRLFLFFYFFYFDDLSVTRLSLIPLLGNDRRPRRRVVIVAGVVLGVSPSALEKAEDFTACLLYTSAPKAITDTNSHAEPSPGPNARQNSNCLNYAPAEDFGWIILNDPLKVFR